MDLTGRPHSTIELEGKYLLSEEGVRYCRRRRVPLQNLAGRNGRIGTGFVWKRFHAGFVQKLVANRLLGSIDIDRPELLTKRPQIVDTTKLLVYGMLYKKFRPTVRASLLGSDNIRRILQRSSSRVPENFRFPEARVRGFVTGHEEEIEDLKLRVLATPYARIGTDESLTGEDRVEKRRIARKFLDVLDNDTWYLFHLVDRTADRNTLVSTVSTTLLDFVAKTKIADYLAFIVMEMIQILEPVHFETVASRTGAVRPRRGTGAQIETNPQIKDSLVRHAAARGELMDLHFDFDTNPTGLHKRQRISISITASGLIAWGSQEEVKQKKRTDVREIPLSVFYKEGGTDSESNLGLFYLSYLEDACVAENARFDANLYRDERRDETVTTMILDL